MDSLTYVIPAVAPAATTYFLAGELNLTIAGIAGAGALAGVFAGKSVATVGGWLDLQSTTSQNAVIGISSGVGAGLALYFLAGAPVDAIAPIAGVTALASFGAEFVTNYSKIN